MGPFNMTAVGMARRIEQDAQISGGAVAAGRAGVSTSTVVVPSGPPATGATSGTPGAWTPAGAAPPANLAAAQAIFPYEDPLPWAMGSYVVLGDGSEAYWGGVWKAGRAPQPATGALAGTPGTWTPAGSEAPYSVDYAFYAQPVPPVTYAAGQYNVTGDGLNAWFDASVPAWLVGIAPPLPTSATPGTPGSWTPASARQPYNLAETAGIVPTPATAFVAGDFMLLADGTSCHWTGAAWAIDPAAVATSTTSRKGR